MPQEEGEVEAEPVLEVRQGHGGAQEGQGSGSVEGDRAELSAAGDTNGFVPLVPPGTLDSGPLEDRWFADRARALAGALGAVFDEMPRLRVASFFAGAVDGMARAADMLGLLEAQFARCDSDPAIIYYWKKARIAKEHRFDWGDIEAVPGSQLQATMENINLLLVSPPCGDWSRAGKQLRGRLSPSRMMAFEHRPTGRL